MGCPRPPSSLKESKYVQRKTQDYLQEMIADILADPNNRSLPPQAPIPHPQFPSGSGLPILSGLHVSNPETTSFTGDITIYPRLHLRGPHVANYLPTERIEALIKHPEWTAMRPSANGRMDDKPETQPDR